ncbi:MAG: M28 family peptidase [Gemmatimonadaceae bacterium]|nr:M28 family peptidase [Gemmatimonadaceae bacterium]
MSRPGFLLLGALSLPVIAAAQMPQRPNVPPAELPRTHAPKPTTPAITPADLMTRLYIFADDSMQGRETGTEGNRRGLRYIEGELKRLGLTPMGDSGGYLQAVPLVKRGWNADFTVTVDGTQLAPWSDVVPLPLRGAKPRSIDGATVIYGGTAEEAAKAITAEQAAGKIIVIKSPGGLRVPRLQPGSPLTAAAGLALSIGAPVPAQFLNFFRVPGLAVPDAQQGPVPMAPTTMVLSDKALRVIFGVDAASLTPGQTGKALTSNLTFAETPSPAYNVVAMIPGSDPALKGQFVAIGAHNDHDGVRAGAVDHDSLRAFQRAAWTMAGAYAGLPPLNAQQRAAIRVNVDSLRAIRPARLDSIYNGADDDGSGSMAVLEIAENVARSRVKPKRSILFVWHTGEEKGLLGAQWISEHFPVSRDSIVAQINIDMIGRGDSVDVKGGGPTYVGVVGAKRLSSMLGATVDSIAASYRTPIALDYRLDADGHPENIYCRSDHYHYARMGIPVAFFFTGLHGDYHQVTDEPQYIDYPHYSLLTNYIRDVLVTVGNGAKPVVDKPKPDPNGQCRQ